MAIAVPKPDPRDHVTDLADDVISQQPAAVVLQHGINDAVQRHDHPQRHQDFHPGKTAAERIHGGFGGERAHEHRAVERRFAVGIGQPGVERRNRGIENEPNHDQIHRCRRMLHVQRIERPVALALAQCSTMPASRTKPPATCTSK